MNPLMEPAKERSCKQDAGCVVLSAGRSGRMGTPKALLPFPPGGTYMSHIIDAYLASGIGTIALVVAPSIPTEPYERMPGVIIVRNPDPDLGRSHSLRLGLAALPNVRHCFIQNIDNPFVEPTLIDALYAAREEAPYITPQHKDRSGHPVLIERSVMEFVLAGFGRDTPLNMLFSGFERHRVPTDDPHVLVNINTPEDHARYCAPSIHHAC